MAHCGAWNCADFLAIGPYSVYPRTSVVEGNQIVNIAAQWYGHQKPIGPPW
jgi:hypothetical protein